jgi:hypothetical protein
MDKKHLLARVFLYDIVSLEMEEKMVTQKERATTLALLSELARDFHKDFCVVQPGVPQKPQSEKDKCRDEIYGIAKAYGIDAATVDQIMDQAEKSYAQYAEV